MRVTCLIDSLGCGGAQRQLCMLAVLLRREGMDVSVLTYHPDDFFLPMITRAGIDYRCIHHPSRAQRAVGLRRALRKGHQDVVIAFLEGSCLYAETAGLPSRRWGLVVSERSIVRDSARSRFRLALHRLADYVTTNSHTNRLMMARSVPALAGRLVTIYNAVDLDAFQPQFEQGQNHDGRVNFVVAASQQYLKNPSGLVEALAIARHRAPWLDISVDWYGAVQTDPGAYRAAAVGIRRRGLQGRFRLHPARASIADVYRKAAAVILPSFFEGLPNVVCEAMACGRPVLASGVCDAGNLVKEGANGFLFDPTSPEDITRAILSFARLSVSEREALGRRGREMAEQMFDPTRFARHYAQILDAAVRHERVVIGHWVPEVPQTALQAAA